MTDQGTNLGKGHVITPGGFLMLGQEQDSLGGGFSRSQSFQGMLSNFNVWNVTLSSEHVRKVSQKCIIDEASNDRVFQWQDFVDGSRKGEQSGVLGRNVARPVVKELRHAHVSAGTKTALK